MEEGYRSLRVMENHLKRHHYFAAGRYTIADIALYAYTHLAHLSDYDLAPFPSIRRWLDRVASEPGHISMDWQPSVFEAAQ
jgi:glutathione S-transferase